LSGNSRNGARRIEYVLGNYEETAEGEVRKDLDATFAKWENAKRVERLLAGKIAQSGAGLFVVRACPVWIFGWTKKPGRSSD